MHPLYKKFKAELEKLANGYSKIAIAVSGGSDSMAMALLMAKYAKESVIQITAITVDHGLRPEAAAEAVQVGLWLEKHNIKHLTLCWEGTKKHSNIQAEARKARYRLMSEYCAKNDIKLLAVAHTSDDQAETVLMRMMRGSGVDGLAGIGSDSEVFGIKIIRPLLNSNRLELQEYLQSKKQEWIEDPSNENAKYQRVRVRKFIKASNEPELLVKRLADTASHMARAKDYIEERIRERLVGVFTFNEAGFYTINTTLFKTLHPEERLRSLSAALQHVGGQDYRPRFENLSNLHDNIINDNIESGCTLWGCEISKSKKKNAENIIYIQREYSLVEQGTAVSSNSQIIWDGRFVCEIGEVNLANMQVSALRIKGYKEIYQQDKTIINATKLPKKVIYTIPSLIALEKVLAAPHIGYYANEQFKKIFYCSMKTAPKIFK